MSLHSRILRLMAGAVAAMATMVFAPASQAQQRPLVWGDTLPATLDPHAIFDVPSQFVLLNAYDGLYRYQGNPPQLIPWLAESHSTSADGLTWEFTLRAGIKFQDGSDMTAEDVVYSFRRLLGMNRAPAAAFSPVKCDRLGPAQHSLRALSALCPILGGHPTGRDRQSARHCAECRE